MAITTIAETPELVEYSFEFRGSAGEYFKIWSSNLLLSLITLGIYAPWAKVRSKRYFNGSTFLADSNFDYHAKPLSILFARIMIIAPILLFSLWVGEDIFKNIVYLIFLAVFLPWAYVRGLSFNARNSSFQGLRFSFHKTYLKVYVILLPIIIALLAPTGIAFFLGVSPGEALPPNDERLVIVGSVVLSLWFAVFLLLPLMFRTWHSFKACGHSYGGLSFGFNTPGAWRYYVLVLSYVLFLLVSVLVGFFVYYMAMVAIEKSTFIFSFISLSFFVYLIVAVLIFYINQALYLCLFWNHLTFPGGKLRCHFPVVQFAFKILFVNRLFTILSLGLLYPWAKVRRARYLAEHIKVIVPAGMLQDIIAQNTAKESAFGEEFSDIEGFDFDVGLI